MPQLYFTSTQPPGALAIAPGRALHKFALSGPDATKGDRAAGRRLGPHWRMRTIPGAMKISRVWTARSEKGASASSEVPLRRRDVAIVAS
jgi:hypothetical protein